MNRKLQEIKIRLASMLCVAAILLTAFAAVGSVAAQTEFDTYAESRMKITTELRNGDAVEIQLHTMAETVSYSIATASPENGRGFTVELFNWNENIKTTVAGEVLHTWKINKWADTGLITVDLTELPGGSLPAGEHVLRFSLDTGTDVVIERYMPAVRGISCFENELHVFGSYTGKIVSKDPVDRLLDFITEEINVEYHTAPPEWQPEEDSAIVQLGVDSTQWTAVDGLGRTLPDYSQVGGKKDRKVGIFYWTWHYNFAGNKPWNVTEITTEYPEALNDFHHKIWQTASAGAYWWNQPLWGYYTEYDSYVLRKHAELLADAGVDFVLFDCTNGSYTWEPAYMNLLKVWSEARADGIRTPQIGFMLNFGYSGSTLSSLRQIYEAIYKDGKYQDLWFYWEGKPLVMSHNGLDLDDEYQAEIANFFTFRGGIPSYFDGDNTDQYWGWLHKYPQALYKNEDGSVEMTTVGIAMNANYVDMYCSAMNGPYNMGRSFSMQPDYFYTYKYAGKTVKCSSDMENSMFYGINFQEQWDYALKIDPEIIFVTGWNEWIAGRNEEWGNVPNGFPDQCNDENSRDIEPSKGLLKDYYYYQLVANIRRYKGVSRYDAQTRSVRIDINGSASQWDNSKIVTYNHYAHNTYERDIDGWAGTHYTNPGIRNDIVRAKVSYDKENVYFYVETADPLTPETDDNWMRLLLDTEAASADYAGWEEFEYILNRTSPDAEGMVLERSTGGWNWETVGHADYSIQGNVLQVAIPRKLLGFGSGALEFNFKWADANLADGDIMTLYTDGDAAPEGRFCFHFTTDERTKGEKRELAAGIVFGTLTGLLAVAAAAAIIMRKKPARQEETVTD